MTEANELSNGETVMVENLSANGYDESIDETKQFPYQTAEVTLIVTDNTFFKTNKRTYVIYFEKTKDGSMEITQYTEKTE